MNLLHFFGSTRELMEVRRIGDGLNRLAGAFERLATVAEKLDSVPPGLHDAIAGATAVAQQVKDAIPKP